MRVGVLSMAALMYSSAVAFLSILSKCCARKYWTQRRVVGGSLSVFPTAERQDTDGLLLSLSFSHTNQGAAVEPLFVKAGKLCWMHHPDSMWEKEGRRYCTVWTEQATRAEGGLIPSDQFMYYRDLLNKREIKALITLDTLKH